MTARRVSCVRMAAACWLWAFDAQGNFSRGALVSCVNADGAEVARGLVNYNAEEVRRIMGQSSERIAELLGYVDEPELIHRDNMVVLVV